MTKPIDDFFAIDLLNTQNRFFCVLTNNVLLETSNPIIDKLYKRGIYTFSTAKSRNLFTKLCNDDKTQTVAYSYTRKLKGN